MASFYPINAPLVNYFFYNYTQTQTGSTIPIAGGKVFFFEDNDHTVPKPTYSDVSDPNNPVVNTNPLVLNDAGATPLYYAEPGLYYIVVTGPDGDTANPIWTFEHVDFEGGAGNGGENVINYMPNGQFLLHVDLPAIDGYDAGEIRADTTNIAWGGWTFERSTGSTAVDIVTFEKYTQYAANPTGNPLYSLRYQCTTFDSGDAYKGIRLTYPDVNRFASDQQRYTVSFQGVDNLAGSVPVSIYLIKNFGTGGSAQTATLLTTVNLNSTMTNYAYSFLFGNNSGKVIGSQGDDFVALEFRFPTNELNDVNVVCFQQQSGTLLAPVYPETTQRQDVTAALGGGFPVPNPDGSDLYLMPKLTAIGWIYDDSCIGDVAFESQNDVYVDNLHPTSNRLLPTGQKYETIGYSPLGIPYGRLQQKYWVSSANIPRYGTGADYFSVFFDNTVGSGNQIIINNNTGGAVTDAADGTPATGFTINTIHTGADYLVKCYFKSAASIVIENLENGLDPFITAGTSGFSVGTFRAGTPLTPQISELTVTAPAGLGGKYFTFSNATDYYVWFTLDGAGSDPAPGGTGILVKLYSFDSAQYVARKIQEALNSWQLTTVLTTVASTVPAGSYFNLNATGGAYYVWFTKDGVGTDPAPGGTGIQVDLLSSDTETQVATKIQIAINSKYFAVPDWRGWFLRGKGGIDPFQNDRWSLVPGITGNEVGTFENDSNQQHRHDITFTSQNPVIGFVSGSGFQAGTDSNDSTAPITATIGYSGLNESVPKNASVNYAIIY